MKKIGVPLLLLAALACSTPRHLQTSDPEFDAIVEHPAVARDAPQVLFDEAHNNFHTASGRYAGFVTLLKNDGFRVAANRAPFTESSLGCNRLLVIANADFAGPDRTAAFTAEEIAAVVAWVERGGSLLLIADHAPFGAAANALAQGFGVTMLDAHLKDEVHHDPTLPGPYFLLFDRQNGLLGDHPILAGRNERERIDRVVTFGGQALRAPAEATPLLRLASSARIVEDTKDPQSKQRPVEAGESHAVALRHGKGRVVILGEAAVFSAQVVRGDVAKQMGLDEFRMGMSRKDTDNRQLALNTARWLVAGLER